MRHRDRGLDYRRTEYLPGFGLCPCSVCRYQLEAEVAFMRDCAARGIDYEPPAMGSPVRGCCYVNREKVFAEEWEAANLRSPGINYGMGTLQDLMVVNRETTRGPAVPSPFNIFRWLRIAFVVTPRERVIVATVIQWLGTNVGFAWLREVLDKCGYEVREKERKSYSRPAKAASVVLALLLATAARAQFPPTDNILAPAAQEQPTDDEKGGEATASHASPLAGGRSADASLEVEGGSGDDGAATAAPASPSPWVACAWMPLRTDKPAEGDDAPGFDMGVGAALHAFRGRWWRVIPAAVGVGRETVAVGAGWVFTRKDAGRPAALLLGYAAPYTVEHGIEVGSGELVIGIAGTIPGRSE